MKQQEATAILVSVQEPSLKNEKAAGPRTSYRQQQLDGRRRDYWWQLIRTLFLFLFLSYSCCHLPPAHAQEPTRATTITIHQSFTRAFTRPVPAAYTVSLADILASSFCYGYHRAFHMIVTTTTLIVPLPQCHPHSYPQHSEAEACHTLLLLLYLVSVFLFL